MVEDPPQTQVSTESIIEAVRTLDMPTTQDIADEVGLSNEGARIRMSRLEDEGIASKREIGTAYVWRLDE